MAEGKKIRYVGPFDEVGIPALGQNVKRGHQIEVTDKTIAAGLLEQADWEEVGAKAKAPAAETEAEKVVKGG